MPANAKTKGKSLPYNLEAEQSLLSCLLIDGDLALELVPVLDENDFFSEAHRHIFSAMQKINLRPAVIDISTLTDQLEREGQMAAVGGMNYLVGLTTLLPSSANHAHYLEIVRRNSSMRKLIHSCTDIIEDAYSSDDAESTIAAAEKKIFDINQNNLSGSVEPLSKGVAELFGRLQQIQADSDAFKGVMTGFTKFDEMTNGFQRGNLIILAATTGVGKSAMAINIIENAGKNKKTVAYFSLEMPLREIAQRIVSSLSGVPMSRLSTGKFEQDVEWTKLWEVSDLIKNMHIFTDDSSLTTPAEIRSKCLRLKAKQKLDLVVIDYLQLMSLTNKKTENRQLEVSEMTRNLKVIAKELDVPILALSQLSREAAKRNVKEQKEPVLSDLRESGAIEQHADMVLFIYKKYQEEQPLSDAPQDVELIVAKNRNGPTFKVPLKWIGEHVRFVNSDAPYIPPQQGGKKALRAGKQTDAPPLGQPLPESIAETGIPLYAAPMPETDIPPQEAFSEDDIPPPPEDETIT